MAGARVTRFVFFACLFLAGTITGFAADPPKEDRCLSNKQLIELLSTIHNRGRAMYNSGDVAGCYRFFQGALSAVQAMLPKDIQEDVTQELANAERQFDPGRRAFALHELIETVRKRLHPSGAGIPLPKPRKLDGETDEPPKAKTDSGKPKTDAPPLLLDPPKPKGDAASADPAKPKPIISDGLTIPLPKPIDPPLEPKKEAPKKEPVKIEPDLIAPPLKLDFPVDKPLITIPSGGSAPKPEPLPPPRVDLPVPAIPTSNPKPKPSTPPMPPASEPPTIILPPGK